MRYLVKTFSKLFFSTVINALLGIVKNKLFALMLGTAGLGLAAQFISLNNFIVFVGGMGIPLALIKYVSELKENKDKIQLLLQESISIILIASFFFGIIGVFFSRHLSSLLLDSEDYGIDVLFVIFSFPGIMLSAIFDAYLRGHQYFTLLVKVIIVNAIISVVVSVIFVYSFGIKGVAISLLVSSIIALLSYVVGVLIVGEYSIKTLFQLRLKFSSTIKNIFIIGVASFVSGGLQHLSLLVVRTLVLKQLGPDSNGIYQSIYLVSSNYLNLLVISLSYYALPVLSGLKEQDVFSKELNSIYRLSNLIIIPIIVIVFTFRNEVFNLLFSSKFLAAGEIMIYNSIGDFFKMSSWVLSLWYIPKGRIKLFVISEFLANFNFVIIFLILLFIFNFGLSSVVIAYGLANFVQFFINYYFIREEIGFKFQKGNLKLFVTSLITVLVVNVLSQLNVISGYIILFPALLGWLFLNVSMLEIHSLKNMIFESLKSG
ncbi:MAG: oligosaccharide flippase family protein [Ignavibacteria bacterium]